MVQKKFLYFLLMHAVIQTGNKKKKERHQTTETTLNLSVELYYSFMVQPWCGSSVLCLLL